MRPRLIQKLWDLFCLASVLGIWPRYVEPNLLSTSRIAVKIPGLPTDLGGLRLVQFSDLHLNQYASDYFLEKLRRRIMAEKPHLILFSGDFLCYARMPQPERLKGFLTALRAPYGCYTVFGNHDYSSYVSVNEEGEYDVVQKHPVPLVAGFKKLFSITHLGQRHHPRVKDGLPCHPALLDLLKQTPFQVLENRCELVPVGNAALNICGVGDYWAGNCRPERAFANYASQWPGVVIGHNPDSFPLLKSFPAQLILVGHTHGAQINLPLIRRKFLALENPQYVSGRFDEAGKTMFVNRGVGSVVPMRWFSVPQILVATLERETGP